MLFLQEGVIGVMHGINASMLMLIGRNDAKQATKPETQSST
jgi:hypothetical protein